MQANRLARGHCGNVKSAGEEEESCFLKEEAASINAEHLPETARGVFQESIGHPCWGVSHFTNQTQLERCAQRAFLLLKPLVHSRLQQIQTCAKPSSEILFYPHKQEASSISQALKTKGTIYRCGYSQFSLDPFLPAPSSLQACASCQWHLCKIPPRARIKDHT